MMKKKEEVLIKITGEEEKAAGWGDEVSFVYASTNDRFLQPGQSGERT